MTRTKLTHRHTHIPESIASKSGYFSFSDWAVSLIRYLPPRKAVIAPRQAPINTAAVANVTPIQIPNEFAKTKPPPDDNIETGRNRTEAKGKVGLFSYAVIFQKKNIVLKFSKYTSCTCI